MPKRKRDFYEKDGDSVSKRNKHVYEAYTQSKKLLNRAFKTAKGFERQKLGKRLKVATASRNAVDMARLRREIEVLRKLELAQVTEVQLNRFLLKVKVFAESEYLPEEVKRVPPKPETSEEMATALHNVTSGMCNTKQVKEAMEVVMRSMYAALGVPPPTKKSKMKAKEHSGGQSSVPRVNGSSQVVESHGFLGVASSREDGDEGSDSFHGFDSGEDDQDEPGIQDNEDIAIGSMDEEDISRFESLLGGSPDEDSFDSQEYTSRLLNHLPSITTTRQPLSLSPPPDEVSDPTSESDSNSSAISKSKISTKPSKPKSLTKKTPPLSRPSDSTFLPTLMGGYWSGSDESASSLSDTEDFKTTTSAKKNRPGQMARRAIWEKKYGKGAKHIKSGMGSVAEKVGHGKEKDDGWDAKRGAKDNGRRGRDGRGRGRGGGATPGLRQPYTRQGDRLTGENAAPVVSKARGQGRKDDVGVLHPSWQAAKKAKEMKKTAKFEGKKVTFD